MKFKELTSGNVISILDTDAVAIKDGIVKSVSLPHFDSNYLSSQPKMVVDLEVSIDGNTKTFTMSEDSEFVHAGSLIITTNYSSLKSEVEKIKREAEATLSTVDKLKERVALSSELLCSFEGPNSSLKSLEDRLARLEEKIEKMLAKDES